jgi:hypothetical protein
LGMSLGHLVLALQGGQFASNNSDVSYVLESLPLHGEASSETKVDKITVFCTSPLQTLPVNGLSWVLYFPGFCITLAARSHLSVQELSLFAQGK